MQNRTPFITRIFHISVLNVDWVDYLWHHRCGITCMFNRIYFSKDSPPPNFMCDRFIGQHHHNHNRWEQKHLVMKSVQYIYSNCWRFVHKQFSDRMWNEKRQHRTNIFFNMCCAVVHMWWKGSGKQVWLDRARVAEWMNNFILTVCPLTSCAVSMVHTKLCVSSNIRRGLFRLSNISIHSGAIFLPTKWPNSFRTTNENFQNKRKPNKNQIFNKRKLKIIKQKMHTAKQPKEQKKKKQWIWN